jgi:hypothetical protein
LSACISPGVLQRGILPSRASPGIAGNKKYRVGNFIEQACLGDRPHVEDVLARGEIQARQVKRPDVESYVLQRHQVFPVAGDVHGEVIEGVFIASDGPEQSTGAAAVRRYGDAVVYAGLDSRALLIIVPGNELQRGLLIAG